MQTPDADSDVWQDQSERHQDRQGLTPLGLERAEPKDRRDDGPINYLGHNQNQENHQNSGRDARPVNVAYLDKAERTAKIIFSIITSKKIPESIADQTAKPNKETW